MKTLKSLLLIIALFISTSCGIGDAIKKPLQDIADSIEKVSNAAASLLDKINDISRLVDSKLESGELSQGVADMVDSRLATLAAMLESTVQNSGGYIFDRLDGSVDNAFGELNIVLDNLLAGVLGNYVPAIIDQIGSQMQLQINTISSAVEDLVIVTAGQTVYVIDKAINGLVITISVIVLALVLIIFAIIFLKKGRKLTGANYIGVGLLAIFLIFFLTLILSPTVRGKIIAGFDYGAALKIKEITPKITSVMPENIVLGKTKRIYVYGTHLNKLSNIAVKLTQGGVSKFQFPQNTLIVNTSNRIVLGNLDTQLQWIYPLFQTYKSAMIQSGGFSQVSEEQAIQVNKSLNLDLYPEIKPGISVNIPGRIFPVILDPSAPVIRSVPLEPVLRAPVKRVEFNNITLRRNDLVTGQLGIAKSADYLSKLKNFFFRQYKIDEGDYGLMVYTDSTRIESPQFVTVTNPPPPVPVPDIFVMDMNWTNNVLPVARQSATLDITFGFSHPEQIQRDFNAKVVTSPTVTSFTVNVPKGKIAAATSGNKVVVTSNPFTINNPGNLTFNISVDDQNQVPESSESNNTFSKNLAVGQYVYDVTLGNFSFEAFSSLMKSDLSYSLVANAGGFPESKCEKTIAVNSSTTVPIDCSFSFPGMKEGQTVFLTFIPVVKLKMFFMDLTFNLGNVSWQKYLDVNPTGVIDSKEYDILREGKDYKLHGKMTVTRRRSS